MSKMIEYANKMRQEQTGAERVFCDRVAHLNCYSQVVIGPYIADFLFPDKCLVVEVDGGYHNEPEQILKDAARDSWMKSKGLKVIRIQNAEAATFPLSKISRLSYPRANVRLWLDRAIAYTLQIPGSEKKPATNKGRRHLKPGDMTLGQKKRFNEQYYAVAKGQKRMK